MMITKRSKSHIVHTDDGLTLLANRREGSVNWQFPPAEFSLGETPYEEIQIGPKGVLYTYSIVHVDRERGPYALAMVDFEPGVRAFGPMIYEAGKEPPLGAAMEVVSHTLADGSADYGFQQMMGAHHE
jgi:uncharacterized OB-fold protein